MKCKLSFSASVAAFLVLFSNTALAVTFNDGELHVIDYPISGSVFVDWDAPEAGTRLEIVTDGEIERLLEMYGNSRATVDGGTVGTDHQEYGDDGIAARDNSYLSIISGSIETAWACENSTVQIEGGSIPYGLSTWDNSNTYISGGVFGDIQGCGESTVEISGGSLGTWTGAYDNCVMTILGGQYEYGLLAGRHDSSDYGITEAGLIRFAGTDFSVNGHAVGYGESALPYATPVTYYGYPGLLAAVTGTLASGQTISKNCYIFGDSDVVFIPEPATLLLLAMGATALTKRK
jgi:hypothetical protein